MLCVVSVLPYEGLTSSIKVVLCEESASDTVLKQVVKALNLRGYSSTFMVVATAQGPVSVADGFSPSTLDDFVNTFVWVMTSFGDRKEFGTALEELVETWEFCLERPAPSVLLVALESYRYRKATP